MKLTVNKKFVKNYLFRYLLVFLFLQVVCCSPEKITTKQIQDIPDHPRIMISKYDTYKSSNKIDANDYFIKLNEKIINVADGMLQLKPRRRELE